MNCRIVTQIGRVIQRIEEVLLSSSVLMIATLTILNVVCRSVFGFSLAFTAEVSQFCIIPFVSSGSATRRAKGDTFA